VHHKECIYQALSRVLPRQPENEEALTYDIAEGDGIYIIGLKGME
jgi:uncharacterized protein YqiB (DUF1249 family)